MDPLLAGGANVERLLDSASQEVISVPRIVMTTASTASPISKMTGLCKEHLICDCSQFENAIENPTESVFSIGPQNVQDHLHLAAESRPRITAWRLPLLCSLRKIVISIICVVALVASATSIGGTNKKKTRLDRFSHLEECAKKLDLDLHCPRLLSPEADYRCKALAWFLGPGAIITLDCAWNTDFGMLFSLLILRESLGVREPSWHSDIPLQNSLAVCDWKHVQCDETGVSGIYFNNAYLHGTLPSELLGLQNLQTFWSYSSDDLVGSIPTQLGSLTNLKSLELHRTSLTGTIPSELGQLSKLKTLLLHGTQLHGTMPEEICKLREISLKVLDASCKGAHPMVSCLCCYSCK